MAGNAAGSGGSRGQSCRGEPLAALWGGVLFNRLNPESDQLAGLLPMLSGVFLPLYFISVGMRIQVSTLLDSQAWGLALLLLALAVVSKLLCGLGVSANDRRAGIDRWQVIYGLMPRGLPGLVFASTALAAGVINGVQFSALVLMVSGTTVAGLLLLERRLQTQARTPGPGAGGGLAGVEASLQVCADQPAESKPKAGAAGATANL